MAPTLIDVDLLKENPDNPRTITDAKFQQLVTSVKQFPQMLQVRPIAFKTGLDGTRLILGGNMRLRACKEAGLKEVPAIDCSSMTEEQQREFVIRDNVAFGEWDWQIIQADWPEAEEWGLDIPDKFRIEPEAGEDDYEIPDEVETDIVLGDLFEIGDHRLLCGSSTEAEAVVRLLNGKEPYLMVTDPPYGVVYDADWRNHTGMARSARAIGKVLNDDTPNWSEAWSLSPSRVAYVWHAGKYAGIVSDSLACNDFEIRSQIIWVKNNIVISRGDYHWKHEPCWYAVKRGSKGNWASDRKQTTVWDIDKPMKSETGHSTQKPVECMARPIKNHDGDVYDPFLGSGTTMVASQQLNRKCYGMELDPKYCQVIVDRMRKLDPNIPIKKNGLPLLP